MVLCSSNIFRNFGGSRTLRFIDIENGQKRRFHLFGSNNTRNNRVFRGNSSFLGVVFVVVPGFEIRKRFRVSGNYGLVDRFFVESNTTREEIRYEHPRDVLGSAVASNRSIGSFGHSLYRRTRSFKRFR